MDEPTNQQAQDEVAAAEAALRAAQERLDAARKRAAAGDTGSTGSANAAGTGDTGSAGAGCAAQQSPYAGAQAQQTSYSQQSANQQTYSQPNYSQPSYAQQTYSQPTYASPAVGTKDHVAAGLLAILFGWLGIHKFYLGYNTSGFIMLGVSILGGIITFSLAAGVMCIIGIVEGILYLTKSQSEFEQMYVFNKREWF